MSVPFLTLRRAAVIEGIALHCGERVTVRLVPSQSCGLIFARTDLPGAPEIAATFSSITHTTHATTLAHNGVRLATTEHLLAALWMNGITHCRIEVDGGEIPILDGSAREWQSLIEDAGLQETGGARPITALREPIWVGDGAAGILGLPHPALRVSVAVDYGRDYLAPQIFDATLSTDTWRSEIAPARTFTLEEWIAPLRAAGLIRGGGEDNAIVLRAERPSSPLRFPNELARHKALDVLGDMALLCGENGAVLGAHFVAVRAGHELHRRWMEDALQRGAFDFVPQNDVFEKKMR